MYFDNVRKYYNSIKKILFNRTNSFYIAFFILVVVSIFLIKRSFYSFCWSDESFYVANMHRFWQGDAFLVDDWHPTQLYLIILYPIYYMYMLFVNGDTTGVMLVCRLFVIGIGIVVTFGFLYVFGRKYNYYTSLICGLVFLLFQKTNVYGISYNSFGMTATMLFLIVFQIVITEPKKIYIWYCILGVVASINVVANPFLAILFILSLLIWITFGKPQKRNVFGFLFGVFIVSCYCGIVVCIRASVTDVIYSIPYILGDSQHSDRNMLSTVLLLANKCIHALQGYWIVTVFFSAVAIIARLIRHKIKNKYYRCFEYVYIFLLTILCAFECFKEHGLLNYNSLFIAIWFIPFYLLKSNYNKNDVIWGIIFLGTIIYGFCWGIATAYPDIDAIIMGTSFSEIVVVLFCYEKCCVSDREWCVSTLVILCFLVIYGVGYDLSIRYNTVYRDDKIQALTSYIDRGPAKGLYTSETHCYEYNIMYDYISFRYCDNKGKVVFVTKLCPWIYLCSPMRVGAYNTWRTPLDDERLATYYENNEDKIPDTIICLNSYIGNYVSTYDGYEEELFPNENSFEGFLFDYINDNSYKKIETSFGIIWEK